MYVLTFSILMKKRKVLRQVETVHYVYVRLFIYAVHYAFCHYVYVVH